MKKIYLENTSGNHSKYYEMEQQSNGEFIAKWGRISARSGFPAQKSYSMSEWDNMLNKKLNKGYLMKKTTAVKTKTAKKRPAKRRSIDLEFWNKVFGKMNILLVAIENTNPSIDDHNLRWVSDRIEYFNGEERILNKEEMQKANELYRKYN